MTKSYDEYLRQLFFERANAEGHFSARAENARCCAYILSTHLEDNVSKPSAGRYGDLRHAAFEGFKRESAIAIELILKALIAHRKQNDPEKNLKSLVTPTHDLRRLWVEACLPSWNDSQELLLLYYTDVLFWSGRYVQPKDIKHLHLNEEDWKRLRPKTALGNGFVYHPIKLDWVTFNGLYDFIAQHLAT
jgi:CubicO group peptidase (beta-lactamase class C family)